MKHEPKTQPTVPPALARLVVRILITGLATLPTIAAAAPPAPATDATTAKPVDSPSAPSLPMTPAAGASTAPAAPAPVAAPAPPPSSEPAAFAALPPAVPPPTTTRTTVALWAAGVAVVGAATAMVCGVLALQNKSDYEKSPTYANSDNGNNDAAYADGAIALAVAAGVTSLVLYLTRDDADESATRSTKKPPMVSAAPMVTQHGGGAGALLRF